MTSASRTQVALIGCGIISPQHIHAFGASREVAHLAVCCDTQQDRAEQAAQRAREAQFQTDAVLATTDFEAVLADPNIQAVDLCLPHHIHCKIAIRCAEAGKHILCEKPLALTPEDCDAMAEAAKANGVVLMHGENMRTALNVETAAQAIHAGKLGTLVGLQATYAHWQWAGLNTDWRTRPAESGGGHLMDGAIHFIDVLRHLGGDIVGVHAIIAQFRPELGAESEDTGVLNFRFAGGHLGQMFASHASRGRGASPLLTVFGTEGCLSLEIPASDRSVVFFPKEGEPETLLSAHNWQTSFDREIAHFLEVIRNGVPLKSTPADGRENVRVALAAYESAKTGREIPLPPWD